jgi:protein ImuB
MSLKTSVLGPVKASGKKPSLPMACIDIPEFLFQWMVAKQPSWARLPLALVKEEKPTALLLQINSQARRLGLRPGLRYGEALAQVPQLRGQVLSPSQIRQIQLEMVELLRAFSPHIEPCDQQIGVFYLALGGLLGIYSSWTDWARTVLRKLSHLHYWVRIAIGYSHFHCLALTRQEKAPPIQISETPQQELAKARQVPLARLGLPLSLGQSLEQLGVDKVGAFLDLTSESLWERFGKEAYLLHRRAKGELWDPFQNHPEPVFWEARSGLDYAESSLTRLLLLCQRLLEPLLRSLHQQRKAVESLHWTFHFQDGDQQRETFTLADASLDGPRMLELLRLRLERQQLSPINEIELCLQEVPGPPQQLELFEEHSRREVAAANRALDRVRAELGELAVVKAEVGNGHLPTARFSWQPLLKLSGRPQPPASPLLRPLVRRLHHQPAQVGRPREILSEAHRLSGGWWNREIERDYCYWRNGRGEWIWGYWDQRRRSWFVQGSLE